MKKALVLLAILGLFGGCATAKPGFDHRSFSVTCNSGDAIRHVRPDDYRRSLTDNGYQNDDGEFYMCPQKSEYYFHEFYGYYFDRVSELDPNDTIVETSETANVNPLYFQPFFHPKYGWHKKTHEYFCRWRGIIKNVSRRELGVSMFDGGEYLPCKEIRMNAELYHSKHPIFKLIRDPDNVHFSLIKLNSKN